MLREDRLAFECMCASEEGAPRQWHGRVLEIQGRVEDTARKSDVGLVDAVNDHMQPDLNLDSDCKQYCLTKAKLKYHDPRGLRMIEHARLDQRFDPQVNRQHRRSRRGKEGQSRTLVPAANYLMKMYSLFEERNRWKEEWEEGSSYCGPRVGLAEDNPKLWADRVEGRMLGLEGRWCCQQDAGGPSIGFHRVRERLRKVSNCQSIGFNERFRNM